MIKEEQKAGLYRKLSKIQGLGVAKDSKGYNYMYTSLPKLMEKLNPLLKDNNLLVIHYTKDNQVCTEVIDIDTGEKEVSSIPMAKYYISYTKDGEVRKENDPQKLGTAISYYKRYNLGQIFNIITDADNDAAAYVQKEEIDPFDNRNFVYTAEHSEEMGIEKTNCKECKKVLSNGQRGVSKAGKPYIKFICDVCTQEYKGKAQPLVTFA